MCQYCGSRKSRLAFVDAKCSDKCHFELYEGDKKTIESIGYPPDGYNIGDGDYVKFTFCIDCGRIQGKFSIE